MVRNVIFNSALQKHVDGIINDHILQHKDISIVNLVSISGKRDKTARTRLLYCHYILCA